MKSRFTYLRTFESFSSSPQTKPSPGTRPAQPSVDPGTRPSPVTRPSRKSPIRRHKPAVDPKPKAEVEDVIELVNLSASEEQKKRINDYYAKRNK